MKLGAEPPVRHRNNVSDNAAKQLALDLTRRLLGYKPLDDAFATEPGP